MNDDVIVPIFVVIDEVMCVLDHPRTRKPERATVRC